jgi:nucleotide-binding universal stress UspA family protein
MATVEQNGMLPIKRVLCPLDIMQKKGEGLQARIAFQIAKRLGADVEYLYVNPFYEAYASYGPYIDGLAYHDAVNRVLPEEMIRGDKVRLQSFLSDSGVPIGDRRVSIDCQVGPVGDTINDWLGDGQCPPGFETCESLILLSKVRTGALRDFLLGSVATRIIRTVTSPCLVLPEGLSEDWVPTYAIVGESMQNEGLLIRQPELALVKELGVQAIEVVHAFRGGDVLAAGRAFGRSDAHASIDSSADLVYALLEDNVRHKLSAAVEELGPEWTERMLTFEVGHPEALLRSRCDHHEKDGVLVLGRSSTASEFGYLGSTVQHLVSRATLPVLILARQGDAD